MSNPCEIIEDVVDTDDSLSAALGTFLESIGDGAETLALAAAIILSASAAGSDSLTGQGYLLVTSTGHASSALALNSNVSNTIFEAGDASDALFFKSDNTLTTTGAATSTLTFHASQPPLTSSAAASSTVTTHAHAILTLLEQGNSESEIVLRFTLSATSTAVASSTVSPGARGGVSLASTGDGSETVTPGARASLTIMASGDGAETLSARATSGGTLTSEVFGEGSALVEGAGAAWTAPLDNYAMSRYEDFPFNSLAVVDGVLLGLTDEGLYKFEDAEIVAARLDTGITDLGDPKLKRAPYVYIGYRSDGTMKFTAKNIGQGVEQPFTYTLPVRVATDPVPGRAKLGRGARSRYWRFVLENVDGADFTVYENRVMVDTTSRKV